MKTFEERTEERLEDHEIRLRQVEINECGYNERINSLCDKLEEFTKIIDRWMIFAQALFWKVLAAAGGLITISAAFFIWYIQSLPR